VEVRARRVVVPHIRCRWKYARSEARQWPCAGW
jgi:hypothetical protein